MSLLHDLRSNQTVFLFICLFVFFCVCVLVGPMFGKEFLQRIGKNSTTLHPNRDFGHNGPPTWGMFFHHFPVISTSCSDFFLLHFRLDVRSMRPFRLQTQSLINSVIVPDFGNGCNEEKTTRRKKKRYVFDPGFYLFR